MLFDVKTYDNFLTKTHPYHEISYHSRQIKIRVSVAFNRDTNLQNMRIFWAKTTKKTIFQKAHLSLRINTSIIQQYLINQVNVSAITIYPRLFGTRPIGTRLIGTLKIDRVQLERVSLARNQAASLCGWTSYINHEMGILCLGLTMCTDLNQVARCRPTHLCLFKTQATGDDQGCKTN